MRRSLEQLARNCEVLKRFQAVPGTGAVWAATFYVYVDTPWRFRSKEALWKYMGIGLERRRSGNGPVQVRVPKCVNRRLKCMILSAAQSATGDLDSPFAAQYVRGEGSRIAPPQRGPERGAYSGSDVVGDVEKRPAVPPGMGWPGV